MKPVLEQTSGKLRRPALHEIIQLRVYDVSAVHQKPVISYKRRNHDPSWCRPNHPLLVLSQTAELLMLSSFYSKKLQITSLAASVTNQV
ncbi:RNA helicase family protein [Perilla frutescens var. hirtella]|uniref:RNA helicase family protein n=1 Tax=Perilla frutescens var. hirtella TaxID=608512 RepID=A0AAD4JDG2_PERFH|nr:RNA helicase family protein [Perilla frutescens var. hirtella]